MILANYQIYIYRRPDSEHTSEFFTHPNIRICKAPLLEISSTAIRDLIKEGKSIRYLVPDKVFEYLEGSTLYKINYRFIKLRYWVRNLLLLYLPSFINNYF